MCHVWVPAPIKWPISLRKTTLKLAIERQVQLRWKIVKKKFIALPMLSVSIWMSSLLNAEDGQNREEILLSLQAYCWLSVVIYLLLDCTVERDTTGPQNKKKPK